MELLLEDSHHSYIHKLFIGHAGVGKTTELFRLKHSAEEQGFLTCMGRCDIDLDSGDIEYTDVLFYILDLLVNQASAAGLKISERVVSKIEHTGTVIQSLSRQFPCRVRRNFLLVLGWKPALGKFSACWQMCVES